MNTHKNARLTIHGRALLMRRITNGLWRQFFPKGRSLDAISQTELDIAVELLNHRTRKRLGYKTPHEVLLQNGCVAIGT